MWTPWIGSDYEGRELLLLGESCYLLEDEKGNLHQPEIDHPKRYLEYAISDTDYRYRFYTMITRALSNKYDLSDSDWQKSWSDVAHTNYVPSAVQGRGRDRPTATQWVEAAEQWRMLLEKLRPKNVLVLGLGMWELMPQSSKRHDRFNHDYVLEDKSVVKCRATRHPAAGLSWSGLRQAILELEAR